MRSYYYPDELFVVVINPNLTGLCNIEIYIFFLELYYIALLLFWEKFDLVSLKIVTLSLDGFILP